MPRVLPAVRSRASKPTIVGPPAPYFRYPVQGMGYDALLVSVGHPFLAGKWFGGGPFFVWKTTISHNDPLTLQKYTWGYQNLAPHTWLGVTAPYGSYNPWVGTLVRDLPTYDQWWNAEQRAEQYTRGYGKSRPGKPGASIGVSVGEFLQGDIPRIPGLSTISGAFRSNVEAIGTSRRWGYVRSYGSLLDRLRGIFPGIRLRDIPGHLIGRLGVFRKAGDEFLNIAFGWKPFLNDVRDMFDVMGTIRASLDKLLAEQGRVLRRRAIVKHETSVTQPVQATYAYPFAQVNGGVGGWPMTGSSHHTVTRTVEEKIWFVGHWIYYLFHFNDWLWEASATQALFGLAVTPQLLWELLPWSWLIDWFSNVDQVLANLSPNAAGSPLLLDSYLMRHVKDEAVAQCHVKLVANDHPGYNWPAVDHTFRSTFAVETKQRTVGGNPFGLDVQLVDLNDHQLSILAALGWSKSNNF